MAETDMSMSGMGGSGSMSSSTGSGSMSMGGGTGMVMTFYWSTESVPVVFPGWETTTHAGYWCSVAVVFLLGILFQFIFNFRQRFDLYFREDIEMKHFLPSGRSILPGLFRGHALLRRTLRTLVFGLQVSLGYFLMLVVMTYNIMLALAVILGYTLGYFLFSTEHQASDRLPHNLAGEECH